MKIIKSSLPLIRRSFSSSQDSMKEAYELDRLVKKHIFGFTVVPEGYRAIVERLGRFHAILEPGSCFLIPGVDRISHYFPLHQVSLQTRPKEVLTQDSIAIQVCSRIRVAIVDPKKAAYVAKTPFIAALFDAESALQETISKYTLQQLIEEMPKIEKTEEKTRVYGVDCLVHEISHIKLPPSIEEALSKSILALQEANSLLVRANAEAKSLRIIENAIEENPAAASALLTKQAFNIMENSLKESLIRIKEKKKDF